MFQGRKITSEIASFFVFFYLNLVWKSKQKLATVPLLVSNKSMCHGARHSLVQGDCQESFKCKQVLRRVNKLLLTFWNPSTALISICLLVAVWFTERLICICGAKEKCKLFRVMSVALSQSLYPPLPLGRGPIPSSNLCLLLIHSPLGTLMWGVWR